MTGRVAALDFLSVVDVRGADAAAFLHAQLCGDVLGLAEGRCRFTAWCTARGRVVASFLLARGVAGFRMIVPRDIAAGLIRKLRLYVLRSRVELVDRGDELRVAGWFGAPAAPPLPAHEWEYVENGEVTALALAGSAGIRVLLAGPAHALAEHHPREAHASGWILEDVNTRIPWIGSALSEEFLPQELDLEALGGLSYAKGCFPGQEIIQRVHSRGRLKRSLRRFSIAAASPPPAARVLAADGTTQGLVVVAADSGSGSSAGLAVVDIESAESAPLHLESGDLLGFDAARRR